MIHKCIFPDCTENGTERHHVIYSSDDKIGDKYGRHFYCRKSVKGNTTTEHPEQTVWLCHDHHIGITTYNERMWVINRYRPLSCHQRVHYWDLFLAGKYPPGVQP